MTYSLKIGFPQKNSPDAKSIHQYFAANSRLATLANGSANTGLLQCASKTLSIKSKWGVEGGLYTITITVHVVTPALMKTSHVYHGVLGAWGWTLIIS